MYFRSISKCNKWAKSNYFIKNWFIFWCVRAELSLSVAYTIEPLQWIRPPVDLWTIYIEFRINWKKTVDPHIPWRTNFLSFINVSVARARFARTHSFDFESYVRRSISKVHYTMASFSKFFSEIVTKNHLTCTNIIHPGDDRCMQIIAKNFPYSLLGASKFFFPLYFVSLSNECTRLSIKGFDRSHRYRCWPIHRMWRARSSYKFVRISWIRCKRHSSPRWQPVGPCAHCSKLNAYILLTIRDNLLLFSDRADNQSNPRRFQLLDNHQNSISTGRLVHSIRYGQR